MFFAALLLTCLSATAQDQVVSTSLSTPFGGTLLVVGEQRMKRETPGPHPESLDATARVGFSPGGIGLGAGYRRYVSGTFERGLYARPGVEINTYMGHSTPYVFALLAHFGGKYTLDDGVVFDGHLGMALTNLGLLPSVDIRVGWVL